MWPFQNVARELTQKLGLDLPQQFLVDHRVLIETVAAVMEKGRAVRVLEYGAGEAAMPANARLYSQLLSAVAEKTGGEHVAVVFSNESAASAGLVDARAKLIDGTATPISELGAKPFDLVVQHSVEQKKHEHPLHTFWSFIELERVASESAYFVLTDCNGREGSRSEYVRDYLATVGQKILGYGEVSAFRHDRAAQPVSELVKYRGDYKPLPQAKMDGESFLRIYDQVFAPLLRHRAGTFRLMFQTLLSRPGPYTIIETGTTRESGDFGSNGQSSVLFDLFINIFGGKLVTIDIDPSNIRYCRTRTSDKTTLITSDSVKALRGLSDVSEADLIYLDSYDFDPDNPHPSSLHHMQELAAIWGKMKKDTLLVIDDCFGPEHGKHAYVSRFLATLGIPPYFLGYQTGWIV